MSFCRVSNCFKVFIGNWGIGITSTWHSCLPIVTKYKKKKYLWTGVTNQQSEMINSTKKSNDAIYNRADTLKSDSN